MDKNIFFIFLLIIVGFSAKSQSTQHKCGADELDAYYKEHYPEYESLRQLEEEKIQDNQLNEKSATNITIPIVFHVIYRLPEQNISDEQIMSQIDVLNKDFQKLNWDTMKVPAIWKNLIANCEISFVLANRDPNGNRTSGITRTSTTIPDIGIIGSDKYYQTSLGGHDIWDRNQYLNIWVCEIESTYYGYGSFPGAPAASDGIVINFISFGIGGTSTSPTDLGRTATHEIGHWFNLLHLWGSSNCGDDMVSDTPIQEKGNTGCPFFPSTTCSNAPNGDMFMNYMDYSDDKCMNMFTNGQKTRMLAALNGSRSSLFSSKGYNGINSFDGANLSVFPNPSDRYIELKFESPVELYQIQLTDLKGQTLVDVKPPVNEYNLRISTYQMPEGFYVLKITSNQGVIAKKVIIQHP